MPTTEPDPRRVPNLRSRVTFVVGKGGVGKTTLAGALALAEADAGAGTHLLSVDPAHSLGDLFNVALGSGPAPSPCSDRLVLEELDAGAIVDERIRTLTPGLRTLIDRGTYLDLEDADSLLAGSIPGLDELGAAVRIAELTGTRLVVDTAPTGHTLRLLRTPEALRGWLSVFDAMAAKADTVASALVGRDVRMPVEAELDRLARAMDAFDDVVAHADFVVVTGTGAVVAAESRRLVETLEGRGLRVAARVPGRDDDGPAAGPGPQGCEALRSWWRGARPVQERPSRSAPVGDTGGPIPWTDAGLVVFAGKGGVGKTTCAAATAVRMAGDGRVVLLSADPAGSLDEVLDGDALAALEPVQLDADAELERLRDLVRREVGAAFERTALDRAASLDRAVVESLWQLAPPGIDELMAITRLAEPADTDARVVLDTAPTGHFLRLVAMPELALDWTRRVMRILLKYGVAAQLDAPTESLLRFARRFRELRDRLADPARTAFVVVTLDEPVVRAETERLLGRLRDHRLPLAGVIVNRAGPGRVAPRDAPTWRAPEVEEPRGVDALRRFTRAWERVS